MTTGPLLNPESGGPGVRGDSLGGELLWSADGPWPYCAQQDHWGYGSHWRDRAGAVPGTVPGAPVLQLSARDVPGSELPEGKDLLQLVWCALMREQGPGPVVPQLHWRDEAEVAAGGLLSETPGASEGEYGEDHAPEPSPVSPTTAEDYRRWLGPPTDMWETRKPCLRSPAGGSVRPPGPDLVRTGAGGRPAWTQPADWPNCDSGHCREHLLTIVGDIQRGDCGGVRFLRCRQRPDPPGDWRFGCC